MAEYRTLNADPETTRRIDEWVEEHTDAATRVEGLRRLIDAAEKATGEQYVSLERGEIERIADAVERRIEDE